MAPSPTTIGSFRPANDKLLKLDTKSFSAGVDRVSTIASEKTRAVKMSLESRQGGHLVRNLA